MKSLGQKILRARKYAGLLQKQLADKIGEPANKISNFENDKALPSIFILKEIAVACRLHPSYFFEEIEPYEFSKVSEDLKYAYYISRLPIRVQDYIKVAINAMYTASLQEIDSEGKSFLNEKTDSLIAGFPHNDYYKKLKEESKG